MPIKVIYRLAQAAGDTQLQRSDVLSFAVMSSTSDPEGWVGVDENGVSMAEPKKVAEKLGAARSTIMKSFGALERAGYIQWQRAWSPETGGFSGVSGKVRILLPDQSPQS